MAEHVTGRRVVDARCPLRPDEPCTLCHPEATGPQDCPTVGIVMDDEDLRAELARRRSASRGAGQGPSDPG
jgi:hypothetical protein